MVLEFSCDKNGCYCEIAESPKYQILGMFLDTDISTRIDTLFTDWLDDPKMYRVQGNSVIIDLIDDGTIEIRDLLDEGDIDDPVFRMPKEEYRKMVVEWQEIVKQRPKEIIITWDGKEIVVEGRN